jgi:hypothetical protein
MKIITAALVLLTVLSVSVVAQTSSTPETVLQINRFRWFENVSHLPCDDCYQMPPTALDYRHRHREGRGDFAALVVLKNLSSKTVKSINIDFVFRDSATEREFLTYSFQFEQEIHRGKKKELQHKIAKGKEPDNFRPAAPSDQFLDRTRFCSDGPLALDRKTRQLVKIRDNAKLLRLYPCYYLPNVTRIDYADGSVWQP